MDSFHEIDKCRVSASTRLVTVLDLGRQALTGVFPHDSAETVTSGPLKLAWCQESGLLQLAHSFDPSEMYGDNYGYRSGLNVSMISHLENKVGFLERLVPLEAGDVVLDIGSNDATTLKSYATTGLKKVGIDPVGSKFIDHYPDGVELVADFFSAEAFNAVSDRPANVVTSIAMFYDLEDPLEFACAVESILDDDGVWHFEQSYMPSMLRTNSYDTVCHEHLEYYSLSVVRDVVEKAGLKLIDVAMNDVNGGSFAVTATKKSCTKFTANTVVIDWLLGQEERMGLNTLRPFREFEERVFRHRQDLGRLIRSLADNGKTVLGYGASTKGNVILQFCGFTSDEIPAIAEVNADKFGRVTPGTHIPIISEDEARKMDPDYFLVLPWHFKHSILRRESEYLRGGGNFIFPFPEIEII